MLKNAVERRNLRTLSLPRSPSRLLEDIQLCMYSQQTFLSNGPPHIVHSHFLAIFHVHWSGGTYVRPGHFKNVFDLVEFIQIFLVC